MGTKSSALGVGLFIALSACGSSEGPVRPGQQVPSQASAGAAATAVTPISPGASNAGTTLIGTQPGASTPPSAAAGSPAAPPANNAPVIAVTPPAAGAPKNMGGVPFPTNMSPATPPAGMGTAMAPGAPAMPAPTGPSVPVVPAVKGDCPMFRNGTITFMGLGGISVAVGTKASSPTAPFLFYWHGTGSTSGEYALMAGEVASGITGEGGVLVSFQDTTGGDLLSGTAIFGKGDLDVGDQLLACAIRDYNVDPKRVYATGCSAGGLMSVSQLTLRSNYMAAAASNSGGWTAPLQFQGMYTPPLMTVHGAAGSDVVIVDFSETSATADKGFKQRGGFVVNCNHGGGHCGGAGQAGDIWKFFKAHTYGLSPEPWKDGLPAGISSVCKIFM